MTLGSIRGARAATRGRSPASDGRTRQRFWGAIVAAVGLVVVGCVMSLASAKEIAGNDDANARRRFETEALEISSGLHAAIQHEEDLAVSAGAFVAANPDLTTAELQAWVGSVRASERYPELLGLGATSLVRHEDLDAFLARLAADPAVPSNPQGQIAVTPEGDRPFYCLLQATVTLAPSPATSPFGLDYCTTDVGPAILSARDSGQASILAVPFEGAKLLIVYTPVYRIGPVPESVAGRRAAYVGGLGTWIDAKVLLSTVTHDDSDVHITLDHEGATPVSFSNGDAPDDAQSMREELRNGWSVTITTPSPDHGILTSDGAAGVLVAGCVASAVLGLLVYALATGRRRALRLVARRTDELRHQALHDALTGLPNRTLILDRAAHLLALAQRNDTAAVALYVDLDAFKSVNDSLGHEAGDRLLQTVAARLMTGLRNIDTIGRLGGDEFVVLLEAGSSPIATRHVAERLLEIIREPFELSNQRVVITTSIGIATATAGSASELLRDADIALYCAKAAGRDCYEVFLPDMEADVRHEYALQSDLRSALADGQFRLEYQAIYDLSRLTVAGAEALLRWDHPLRGVIPPGEFIPALESSGQIVDVGRWVLVEACRQAMTWREQGHDLTMSVNVSARQLDRDSIIDHVTDALSQTGMDPSRLVVEITETALMKDTDRTARRLGALERIGVRLAIDDFGTGYSSLAYLQRFPVDCLKIDRTFVHATPRSPESDALVHTLVRLGKDLGLTTLAEGVETSDELDHLRMLGVDLAQGFLLARPLSPVDFEGQLLRPLVPRRVDDLVEHDTARTHRIHRSAGSIEVREPRRRRVG